MALLLRKRRSAIRNESAIQESIRAVCEMRDQLRHRTDEQLCRKAAELSEAVADQRSVDQSDVADLESQAAWRN